MEKINGLIYLCDIALNNNVINDDYYPPFEPSEKQIIYFQKYYEFQHNQKISKENVNQNMLITYGTACHHSPYKCIREWRFLYARLPHHPKYISDIKEIIAKNKENIRILDVGCCFGVDMRYLILKDEVKVENILGIELYELFVKLGFLLFNDTKYNNLNLENIFLQCNMFDSDLTKKIEKKKWKKKKQNLT